MQIKRQYPSSTSKCAAWQNVLLGGKIQAAQENANQEARSKQHIKNLNQADLKG
jgi:hypothetical protein